MKFHLLFLFFKKDVDFCIFLYIISWCFVVRVNIKEVILSRVRTTFFMFSYFDIVKNLALKIKSLLKVIFKHDIMFLGEI